MQMNVIHAARWDGVIVLVIVVLWAIASARCQDVTSMQPMSNGHSFLVAPAN